MEPMRKATFDAIIHNEGGWKGQASHPPSLHPTRVGAQIYGGILGGQLETPFLPNLDGVLVREQPIEELLSGLGIL